MFLEPILTLILLRYLRRKTPPNVLTTQWDKLLLTGMGISIALMVIGVTVRGSKPIVEALGFLLVLALVYIVLSKKEFRFARAVAYSLLPLINISLLRTLTQLIDRKFYDTWNEYFDIALFFALVWILAMWLITKKQRKALEAERLKMLEIEKEIKINEKIQASLEIQVAERTTALTLQKEELERALTELKSTQSQLIQAEKMASLGELTAGIAHEIQNPLNFVNNFSEVSNELISEMVDEVEKGNTAEVKAIARDVQQNLEKILHHGKRADSIVKGMLLHSRRSSGLKEATNINTLADEYLRLAYHGLRAKDKSFNAIMKTDFDEQIGTINVIPQDLGRVILNLITNAFYAVTEKKKSPLTIATDGKYEPTVWVSTKQINHAKENGKMILISVKDNGNGVPQNVIDKIFQPFFTTKPTGEGTGLGLSMSYDIITKGHGGEIKVQNHYSNEPGKEIVGAEFIIILPA